ncbi:SPOSA6832_04445, partial [Sporobolomyces salmonicolor]
MSTASKSEDKAFTVDKEALGYSIGTIDENSTDEELLHYQIDPKVGGLMTDINAPANGLSVATSIFYATYVAFEPAWTTLLKTLRPSRLLPTVTLLWGFTLVGSGFMTSYGGLIAVRLVLGFLESALTPCLFLWLTFFYQRDEIGIRTFYMFVSAALSGVVGGLIAAGFLKMDGLGGWEGWRYLFAIEGGITVLISIAIAFYVPDSYHHAHYLTPRQKLLMRVREVQSAHYTGSQDFSWGEVRKALALNQLGYSSINSQLLRAALVYGVGAYICDHYNIRFWLLVPTGLVTCLGYALLTGVQDSVGCSLFACFCAATGIYLCVGLHVSWLNTNIAGIRKRSTAIGIQQLMGNCGGITDKPHYRLGHAFSLGSMALALVGLAGETYLYRSRNAKKLAMTEEEKEAQDAAGVTGDAHWSFMYVW